MMRMMLSPLSACPSPTQFLAGGCFFWIGVFLVVSCIVLVAVVPPVCVLHGCGQNKSTVRSTGWCEGRGLVPSPRRYTCHRCLLSLSTS